MTGRPRYAELALVLVCAVVSLGAAPVPEERRALAEQVRGAMAVARFEAAAGLAEQYAARFPDDGETPAMLATAHMLRSGLGQDELARAARERLDALHRRGAAARAGLLRARIEVAPYGEREPLMQQLLGRYGGALAPGERAVLAAQLGQMQWRDACTAGFELDLCLSISRRFNWSACADCDYVRPLRPGFKRKPSPPRPPPPPRCVDRYRPVVRGVHLRERRDADAAQRRFAAALAEDSIDIAGPDRAAVDDAVVMSAMYAIDARFEELLATDRPRGLKFAFAEPPAGVPKRRWYFEQLRVRARSIRGMNEYFERIDRAAGELERRYGEIVADERSGKWVIAALARIAQVSDYRADVAYAGELPEGLTHPADVAAYCDLARAYAEPLYERAIAGYERCLEVAAATGVLTEYTQKCEEALTQMAPERFLLRTEAFGAHPSEPTSIGLQVDPGLDE
ncbi:hypothetical protein OV090_06125 [Nannocystis sp. RBIL2]|uniref:hypothetical protein n=1 Tax=Nannocystis sp. RBIL2 TaxID=2996788 RepID=UPI00226DC984|nr:hypothetical protein [Nannocystis sp. RBIL2]MCY1064327.1 hypothetical protein [Nannocystis sp. RBIL2]